MTKKNWNNLGKRTLAIFLTLIMCLGMLPISVFAEESNSRKCPLCKLEPGKWEDVDLVYVEEVSSTCQTQGVKAHYMCPNCGRNFHRNVGVPNVYLGPVDRFETVPCDYSVPATCTSKATCKWCGDEDPNGQIDPNNHAKGCTLSTWLETEDHQGHYKEYSECKAKVDEGTHTQAGAWGKDANQHWPVCSVCDVVLGTGADHIWGGGIVTAGPTDTEKGIMTFTCTVCGQTKTEDIDPTGEGGGETSVPVESVTVLPNTATVTVGETVVLTATVTPKNATDKTVTWTSSDETVATVDENGVVTAVAGGNAAITAAAGGQSATCAVTVTTAVPTPPEEVVSVTVNPKNAEIEVGGTVTLTATVTPIDETVTWYSDDESVATVVNGTVTGIKAGTATITAVVGEGLEAKSDTCAVTVTAAAPQGCQHETTKAIDNGDETHRFVCAAEGCDYVFTEEEYAHEPHKWVGDACVKCGVQAVARIDNQYFTTIQAAVDSVEENGTATIEMIADSDKPATIPAGKVITLNLNGKTLTNRDAKSMGKSGWEASVLKNQGTLTVAGNGAIEIYDGFGVWNDVGGTAYVNGGTFTTHNGDYIIFNYGTATINGAVINKPLHGASYAMIANGRDGKSAVLTIENCTVNDTSGVGIPVCNYSAGTVVINAGTFEGQIPVQNGGVATINGGTFTKNYNDPSDEVDELGLILHYGTLTINGGDFYNETGNEAVNVFCHYSSSKNENITVSGGTYFKEDAVVNQYATEDRKLVPIEGQKDRWQLGKDAPGIDLDSLELKVLVQCVNEGRAHVGPTYEEDGTERQTITAAEYALIQDSVTVSELVKNSEGQLTCTVTVEAEKYVSLFNGTVVYKHLPLNQKASVTLTCQDDTWVADGKLLFECVCMPKTEGIVELFVECEENTDHNLMWNNVNYEVFQDESGRQLVNLTDNDEDSATKHPFVCTMTMGAPANILDRYYNGYVKYCVENAPDSPVAHFGLHKLNGEKTGTPSVTFYWNAKSAKWECVNNRVVLFAHGTKQITYRWLDEDGTTALQEPVTQSACKAAPDDPVVAEKSLADGSRKVFREWTEAVYNDGNVIRTAVYDTISATSRAITVNYVDAQGNVISTATVYGTNGLSYTLTSAPAALDANGNRYVLNDTMPKAVGANESSVNVRYAIDNIGGGADGRSPDGIPDIQEAVVYYTTSNEAYGTVAGAYQTFNLGSANASGTVTLGNTASTTTLSRTYFSSWTQSGTVLSTGTDLNVEFAVTAGSTYQVIANFGRTGTGGGGGGGTGGGGTTGGGGGGTTIVDEEVPLAGDTQLNRDDHFAYVSGYADGTVRPTNNITREEVAAIFYRLLTEESRAIYDTDVNDFSDVAGDRWSNRAISTLTNAGILSGYPDGTFRPGQTITRAEFAAIAAQFDVVTEGVENPFSDTTGHWAENLISFAAGKGWVSGYTDGTFLPQKAITRAEAMTLINNVLNRRVDAEGLLAEARQWSDNPEGTWYYYEVLEATNSHDYDRRTEGELVENWTAVTNG